MTEGTVDGLVLRVDEGLNGEADELLEGRSPKMGLGQERGRFDGGTESGTRLRVTKSKHCRFMQIFMVNSSKKLD